MTSAAQTVVIVDGGFAATPAAIEVLERAGLNVVVSSATDEEDRLGAVRDADGIIDNGPFSRQLIEALTRCKVIARSGIGMDLFEDVGIARPRGSCCAICPGSLKRKSRTTRWPCCWRSHAELCRSIGMFEQENGQEVMS